MDRLGDLPIVRRLLASDDPTVVVKARRDLLGEPPSTLRRLQSSIAGSDRVRRLLSHRAPDGRIATNPYAKWQGPHWTLVQLALAEHPAGRRDLAPLRDQAYEWMLSPQHLRSPRTVRFPDQPERVRRCASQEGNAVWYSLVLGLEDARTPRLVDRLVELQWPDGGWNCDTRPEAGSSSFVETLIPCRALALYGRARADHRAAEAAGRACAFLLRHRLLWRVHDGALLTRFAVIEHPIRFYDLLFALEVMAEAGWVSDPRCAGALDLLEQKRLPDGGFPAERTTARTVTTVATRGTFADWGPGGRTRSNPLVTVEALTVLKAAGRLG